MIELQKATWQHCLPKQPFRPLNAVSTLHSDMPFPLINRLARLMDCLAQIMTKQKVTGCLLFSV